MRKTLLRLFTILSLLLLISFAVIVVNQTAQLVDLADRSHTTLGTTVFWSLVALYAFCTIVPIFMILRLPSPLRPPENELDPAFPKHIDRLASRLTKNPHLTGAVKTREEIDAALLSLDAIADAKTKSAASQIFVTTAISQNG